MAPLVYYLNKCYNASFGGTTKRAHILSNGSLAKNEKPSYNSTNRMHDSSKLFFWLWTTPGFVLLLCIGAGLSFSFYNVYLKELPPSWLYTMADPDSKAIYFSEHMTKIWTHIAVFAIGLIAGVECRRASRNVIRNYKGSNINYDIPRDNSFSSPNKNLSSSSLPVFMGQGAENRVNNSGVSPPKSLNQGLGHDWHSSVSITMSMDNSNNTTSGSLEELNCNGRSTRGVMDNNNKNASTSGRGFCSTLLDITISLIAITIMSLIIFSTHDWSLNDLPKPYIAGLYDAGSRFLWSIGMIWLLYMISVPNKDRSFSLLARSLGHPFMVFLGKLSFLIYIIHPFVHTAVLAIQEQPIYSSWLMLFHILIGNITIIVILASLVSLFVEMPCRNLFRRCGTSLLLAQSDIISTTTTPSHGGSSTTSTTAATTPSTTS